MLLDQAWDLLSLFDISSKKPTFVQNIEQNEIKKAHIIAHSPTDNEDLRREYETCPS
jgi:hypothetical protein